MSRTARVLCEGLYFGECPRWRDGRLWFSDFFAKAVKSVSLEGDVRVEFEMDDAPSGLGWMPDGSMLIVAMTSRRVLKRSPAGKIGVRADLGGVANFYCNDMVVDSTGRAYGGDFGFDLHKELATRGNGSVLADPPTAKLARISPEALSTSRPKTCISRTYRYARPARRTLNSVSPVPRFCSHVWRSWRWTESSLSPSNIGLQ